MSDKEINRKLLNSLVDMGYSAEIPGCFGTSALLRWGEDALDADQKNTIFPSLNPDEWFLFEIGRNCGTVFSADCVKEIKIKGKHAIILLKG